MTASVAHEVDEEQQQQHFAQGFGIFSGEIKQQAKLRFLPAVARGIARGGYRVVGIPTVPPPLLIDADRFLFIPFKKLIGARQARKNHQKPNH